jgi:polar amino acid transport system substrate-binding protein
MSKKLLNPMLVVMMLAVLVPTVLAAPPVQEGGQDYVVVADDWLSKLADKYLGNPFAYPTIMSATNQKNAEDDSYAEITDPDLIEIGWKIYIPSAAEAEAYVSAAPTEGKCEPTVGSPPLLYPGRIIVTINPTIPPFQYVDEDGNLAGSRVELGEEMARRMCLEIEWIRMDFAAMIPGLTAGKFDMINTGTFFKEERAAIMEMVPFDLSGMAVSVPLDDPHNIQTREGLAGLIVGVEAAGVEEKTLREISDELVAQGLQPIDVRTFTDFGLAFAALEAGQLDAVMSVDAAAAHYTQEGRFKVALSGINVTPSTFAFNNTELAQAHADILQELYEEGWLDELYERYGLTHTMLMNWKDWSDPNGDPNNVYGWDGKFNVY